MDGSGFRMYGCRVWPSCGRRVRVCQTWSHPDRCLSVRLAHFLCEEAGTSWTDSLKHMEASDVESGPDKTSQLFLCNSSIFLSSSHLWHHIDCLVPRWRPPKRRPDVVRLLPVRRLGRRRSLPPGRLHDLVLPRHRPRDPEAGEQLLLLQAGRHRHAAGPACQPRQECTSVKKRLSVPHFIN